MSVHEGKSPRSPACENATECMRLMDEQQLDITLLLALKHWDWLDSTRFGRSLKSFIECKTLLKRGDVQNNEFQKHVWTEFKRRRIVNLAPERRVEAYRKEELFVKYRAAEWPQPHHPYLIQMRPGLFILLSNFQAGFHVIRDMARDQKFMREDGKWIPVELLYEGQIEGEPCRCILDCEAYFDHFELGGMSMDDLVESVRQVPRALARELARMGAIRREDALMVVEKDKRRGKKVSFHYIFNIFGDPTVDLKAVLEQAVIRPYREERAVCKRDKSAASLGPLVAIREDGTCEHALLHVDEATIKGRHQFSTVFSRKPNEEPCRISRVLWILEGGKQVMEGPCVVGGMPLVPTSKKALEMLFWGGFTHWMPRSVVLSQRFRITASPSVIGLDGGRALTVAIWFGFVEFIMNTLRETRTHGHPANPT